MSIEKVDRVFGVLSKGVSLLTTFACILFVGFIAYVTLGILEYAGVMHVMLTGVIALVGGLMLNLVLRVLLYMFSY